MKRIVYFLLIVVSFFKVRAQQIENSYYLFLDAKTRDINILVQDSIIYTGNFLNPQKLKKESFPDRLVNYQYQFNLKNKNYFVHEGGGVVLEYSNGVLRRVDQSLLHNNQFSAVPFAYGNQLYLFGGYGLFAANNKITRFNFETKKWFLVKTQSKEKPEAGSSYQHICVGNSLYVFGGKHHDDEAEDNEAKSNLLWQYEIEKSTWKKLGTVKLKYNIPLYTDKDYNSFNTQDKIIILDKVYTVAIDIQKNSVSYYKTPYVISQKKVVYNPSNNTVNYLNFTEGKPKLESIYLKDLFEYPLESEKFYSSPIESASRVIYWPIGVLFGMSFLAYYIKKKKTSLLVKNAKSGVITFVKSKEEFLSGKVEITDLSSLERAVLTFLVMHKNEFIPIHNLNQTIEEMISCGNINSILRKREMTLNSLKTKLSLILNVSVNEVLLEQKNKTDRRIKEIKLNDKYFVVE